MTDLNQLPQCDRCRNYARHPELLCAIHPLGLPAEVEHCPDFEPDPTLPPEACWEPDGASYYAGELIITPLQRFTKEQKLELLDWHPLFTGRCPNCEHPIQQPDSSHWDCGVCEWHDDSM